MRNIDLYRTLVYDLKASFTLDDAVLLPIIRTKQHHLKLSRTLLAPSLFLDRQLQLKLA